MTVAYGKILGLHRDPLRGRARRLEGGQRPPLPRPAARGAPDQAVVLVGDEVLRAPETHQPNASANQPGALIVLSWMPGPRPVVSGIDMPAVTRPAHTNPSHRTDVLAPALWETLHAQGA